MSKHPNCAEILAQRKMSKLTQDQAAKILQVSRRNWQQWELGERKMHPGLWELFCIKIGKM